MSTLRSLLALLLVVTLAGCASSGSVTTGDTSTPSVPPASPDTLAAAPSPESAPDDWFHLDPQTDQVAGMGTRRAYDTLLAGRAPQRTVTLAIIDSGIDIEHEDLTAQVWTNGDEVAGNDVDDDQNGYVDDVNGWNFIGGPNGKNVDEDTFELTRLYADLAERFNGVSSASVDSANRDAYARYQKLRTEFKEKRNEVEQQYTNVSRAYEAVEYAVGVMESHLGTDTLTEEKVAAVSSQRQDVKQAKDILSYFYGQDLGPKDIREYYEYLNDRINYNLNPDFNPRPIVGDDYADPTERYYGNNDVTGPDADHGTHVAGIAAAARDNQIGIDGVAAGVRVMVIRAVPNGDERDKDVANAIRYAVDNGADVINMSFGKDYSPRKDVVDAAVRHADSLGVLMIHAAGNDGENVDSTGNYPSRRYLDGGEASLWIEVGASSWKGGVDLAAPFSNYGAETVDVFAPGMDIYSTVPGGAYEENSGTSMAAPMVAGLASLLMAYFPDLSAAQVRSIILDTATRYPTTTVTVPGGSRTVPFGDLSRTGAIVNAYDAIQRAAVVSGRGS